jgi:hypothetical protein
VTSGVTPGIQDRSVANLELFQTYGLPGLLVGGLLLLLYRLIDRGFTFRVGSRGRERKRS